MSAMNRIALGLIVGWFGCWVCAEVQWCEGVKESPAHLHTLAPSRALAASDVARFVHTLVLNNHTQIGSCVSIGPGAYVTARHIFEDAHGEYLPLTRVTIDDQTVNAQVEHLPPALRGGESFVRSTNAGTFIPSGTSLADAEQLIIEDTLRACEHNKVRAAEVLGISLKTLYTRLNRYEAERRGGDDLS